MRAEVHTVCTGGEAGPWSENLMTIDQADPRNSFHLRCSSSCYGRAEVHITCSELIPVSIAVVFDVCPQTDLAQRPGQLLIHTENNEL